MTALQAKQAWRYVEGKSVWASILRHKYGHPFFLTDNIPARASIVWIPQSNYAGLWSSFYICNLDGCWGQAMLAYGMTDGLL